MPVGGVACPLPLLPQQATVPSVLTPHEWYEPADTAVNVPVGGVACPLRAVPQQATVLSVVMPHEWARPAETELNSTGIRDHPLVPSGLVARTCSS